MSRYEDMPEAAPDFSKSDREILKHYMNAYYDVRRYCIDEICRTEHWKTAAIAGWVMAAILIFGQIFGVMVK
uniref:Uncharacterized protein n=3 Tax=unclassified bacterial viruses TaxID=12333 RepID=A0AAU6W2N4_9VIRU